jgi:lysophospholipase L1-like esterase
MKEWIFKKTKFLSINLLILLVFLTILDFFYYKPYSVTSRVITLKELGVNQDITVMPNDIYMKGSDGLKQKKYILRTDEDGFIIGESNFNRKKDSIDVLFLGGSTTETLYVEESQRFPYLVQENLSHLLGKDIVTVNAGVSGNHSLHSTLNLLAKGIPKNPKIIVLMHNVNDLSGLSKTGTYYEHPEVRKPIRTNIYIKNGLKERARHLKNVFIPTLYSSIKNIFNPLIIIDEWEEFRNRDSIPYSKIEHEFEKSILSFIRIAKSHNIKIILMTQFNRINMTDEFVLNNTPYINSTFIDRYHKINAKIREIALKEKIDLIDLAALVPSSNQYIYDAVHLNTEGSRYVATIITNYLNKKNYLH